MSYCWGSDLAALFPGSFYCLWRSAGDSPFRQDESRFSIAHFSGPRLWSLVQTPRTCLGSGSCTISKCSVNFASSSKNSDARLPGKVSHRRNVHTAAEQSQSLEKPEPGAALSMSYEALLNGGDSDCYRSRHPAVGLAEQSLTAIDLAKGLLDVQGWKVLRNETGQQVGIVDEIIHIGSPDSDEIYESVLKLVQMSPPEAKVRYKFTGDEGSDEEDGLEFLVPLVEDIIKSVDIKLRCLFITPPAGLLELARIPEILKRLEPQLLEFCQHQNAGILSCLDSVEAHQSTRFSDDARQLVAWTGHIQRHNQDVFMPTRRQLLSAGRHDLVDEIMAAGGFLSVAQALGLRSRRRPVGFWEDLRNLDAEIEGFVSGCWVVQQSPETGEEIYYNQATDEYSRQKPLAGNVSDPVPVSQEEDDVGTAVMPRQQQVLEAGRYDLHHAILLHGGYKLVAQELGRQPVSRDTTTKLVAKLREFMEENSFSTFPSFDELRAFERYDLVYSLRKHGGINSVAQMMDLRPKRYGKGQWYSLDCAAAAIRSYMCQKIISRRGLAGNFTDPCDLEDTVWNEAVKAGTLEIPTQAYILKDGRSDLRYLLQKYGRKDLAEHLGIKYVDRRKKTKKSGIRASIYVTGEAMNR